MRERSPRTGGKSQGHRDSGRLSQNTPESPSDVPKFSQKSHRDSRKRSRVQGLLAIDRRQSEFERTLESDRSCSRQDWL